MQSPVSPRRGRPSRKEATQRFEMKPSKAAYRKLSRLAERNKTSMREVAEFLILAADPKLRIKLIPSDFQEAA